MHSTVLDYQLTQLSRQVLDKEIAPLPWDVVRRASKKQRAALMCYVDPLLPRWTKTNIFVKSHISQCQLASYVCAL